MKIIQLIPLTLLLFLVACKKEDDTMEPTLAAPDMSYLQNDYETNFHTTGMTDIPDLEWNGDVGNLSLAANVQGVSLNNLNGVVSWDESLALGENSVTVIATNSEGQKIVPLTITNNFVGNFSGGYNFDPNSTTTTVSGHELNYNADGTMEAIDGNSVAMGTYTISGSTITAIYSFDSGVSFVANQAELTYDVNGASLEGFWYQSGEVTSGGESGYIQLDLVK